MNKGILDKSVKVAEALWTTTPSTTTLSTVDDPTKCVPWGSCAVQDGAAPFNIYNAISLDFLTSPLRLQRRKGLSFYSNDHNTFITQLNSTRVRVQAVTYSFTSSAKTLTVTIPNTVVIANSFPLCYHRTPDNSAAQGLLALKAVFASTTQLTLSRGTAVSSKLDGTVYIVEALDGAFTVQTSSIHLTNSNTSNTGTITPIATDRTMLLATWTSQAYPYTYEGNNGLFTVALTNSSTITAQRYTGSSGDDIDILVYAITFADDVASVQHFNTSVTSGLYVNVPVNSADTSRSIVRTNNNSGMNNGCRVNTVDPSPTAQHVKCTLTSSTNARLTIGVLTENTITGCVVQFENYVDVPISPAILMHF